MRILSIFLVLSLFFSCKPSQKDYSYELKLFICGPVGDSVIPGDIVNISIPIYDTKDSAVQYNSNGKNDESKSPLLLRIDTAVEQSLHIKTKDFLSNILGGSKKVTDELIRERFSTMPVFSGFRTNFHGRNQLKLIDSLYSQSKNTGELFLVFMKNKSSGETKGLNLPSFSSIDSLRLAIAAFLSSSPKNRIVNVFYYVNKNGETPISVEPNTPVLVKMPEEDPIKKKPNNDSNGTKKPDRITPDQNPVNPPKKRSLEDVKDTSFSGKKKDLQ